MLFYLLLDSFTTKCFQQGFTKNGHIPKHFSEQKLDLRPLTGCKETRGMVTPRGYRPYYIILLFDQKPDKYHDICHLYLVQ